MTSAQIAAIRRLLGLTVDQLGQELGINPRTVRGWEAGKYSPSESVEQALNDLRSEHDAELDLLLASTASGPVEVPRGPKVRSWYLALAARLIDRRPGAQIAWQSE